MALNKLSKAARERFIIAMADPSTANELANLLDALSTEENRESQAIQARVKYRASYGSDTLGDGSHENPYKTWKKCSDALLSTTLISAIVSLTPDTSSESADFTVRPNVLYLGMASESTGIYKENDEEVVGTSNGTYLFNNVTFSSGLNVNMTGAGSVVANRLRVFGRLGSCVIQPVADVAGSLAGKWFKVNGAFASFYFWFRVDGVGTDPAVSGAFGVPVDILPNSTPAQIATVINETLLGTRQFLMVANNLTGSITTGRETHRVWCNRPPVHYDIAGPARYFTMEHPTAGRYYVWFNVVGGNSVQTDPAPAGLAGKGIRVDITLADDINLGQISAKMNAAINAVPGAIFTAAPLSGSTDINDIQNSVVGDVPDCLPETSGMNVYVITQGVSSNQIRISQFQGGGVSAPDMGTSGFTLVSFTNGSGCKIQTAASQIQLSITDFTVGSTGLLLRRVGGGINANRDWSVYHAFLDISNLNNINRVNYTGFGSRDGGTRLDYARQGAGVPGLWAIGSGTGTISANPTVPQAQYSFIATADLEIGSNVIKNVAREPEGRFIEGPGIPANTVVLNSSSLDKRKLVDTNGTNVISNIDSTSELAVGYAVTGSGVPANTTITSIVDANSVQTNNTIPTATAREVVFVANRMLISNNATITRTGVELGRRPFLCGYGASPTRLAFTDTVGVSSTPVTPKTSANWRKSPSRFGQALDALASRKEAYEVLPAISAQNLADGYIRCTKWFWPDSVRVQRRGPGGNTANAYTGYPTLEYTVTAFTDPTSGVVVTQINFGAGTNWHSAGADPLAENDVLVVEGETESEIY